MSSRPEPVEPPAEPISVERVGGVQWRVLAVVGVIVAVVVFGVVKPWEGPTSPPPVVAAASTAAQAIRTTLPTPASTPTPTPTIDPVIDKASGNMLCNAPQGWRLLSVETDVLGNSRTMYGADATLASGPTDPIIPTPNLRASAMYGIGVCRPNPGGLRVADLPFNPITIWQITGARTATVVAGTRLLSPTLYRLGEAYYGPPASPAVPSSAPSRDSWAAGRYVIEIDGAESGSAALWIGLDFSKIALNTGAVPVE